MAAEPDPRHDLPPDLTLLFEAFRREFDAKMTSLKYFGIAMTCGGGTIGGLIAGLKPHVAGEAAGFVASLLS